MINGLRLIADGLHALGLGIVFRQLYVKKDAQGISLKTQDLLLLASLSKHLISPWEDFDPDISRHVVYQVIIKIVMISVSLVICIAMRRVEALKSTYRSDWDTSVPHWIYVAAPTLLFAAILALPEPVDEDDPQPYVRNLIFSFGVLLESTALYPQIYLLWRYGNPDVLLGGSCVLLIGAYQIVYLFSCVDRRVPEHEFFVFHENLFFFCIAMLTVVAMMGCCNSKNSNSKSGTNSVPSVSAQLVSCCCRTTPWGTIGRVLIFVPIYFFATTILPILAIELASNLSTVTLFIAAMILACNPMIFMCCYFWYFFRCCRSLKKKRPGMVPLGDEDEMYIPVPLGGDVAVQERSTAAEFESVPSEAPLASPPPARVSPLSLHDDDEQSCIDDDEELQQGLLFQNTSNGMIIIILFSWTSTLLLCSLSVWSPQQLLLFVPILTCVACCLRRYVPIVASDLEEYDEVPITEHELGALSPTILNQHDEELHLTEEEEAVVRVGGDENALSSPLLTLKQQAEAAAMVIEKEEDGEYQAPDTEGLDSSEIV
mmetsp:Transcript_27908/g.46265  ORF Transcript_27908/g.46265 Transcript_27908/m.46265 type:complete len:543 (+) Transcript_27908:205-1833(+)